MKKIFLYIFIFITVFKVGYCEDQSFSISIVILQPLKIRVERNFDFGIHEVTGSDFTVTVKPDGKGSALFQVSGSNNSIVSYTVAEEVIYLSNGKDSIKVGGFKVTGGAPTGIGIITDGELKSIGVGATAFISAKQPDVAYYGNATFRVTYN